MHNTWKLDLKAYSPLAGLAWPGSEEGGGVTHQQPDQMDGQAS